MTNCLAALEGDLTLLAIHARLSVLVTADSMRARHARLATSAQQRIQARFADLCIEITRLNTLEEMYWRDALRDADRSSRLDLLSESVEHLR